MIASRCPLQLSSALQPVQSVSESATTAVSLSQWRLTASEGRCSSVGHLRNEVSQPKHRKLRFWCYQKQQLAYATVTAGLCGGRERIASTVVLWGDGNFGPTSRGYAAAPNKGLRRELALHGVEIHLCDERSTTHCTGCCQQQSVFSVQRQMLKRDAGAAVHAAPAAAAAVAGAQQPPPPAQPPARQFTNKRPLRGLLYCHSEQPHRSPDMTLRMPSASAAAPSSPPLPSSPDRHRDHGDAAMRSEAADSAQLPHSPPPPHQHQHKRRLHSRPWNRDVSAAINIVLKQYLHAFAPQQLPACWQHGDGVGSGDGRHRGRAAAA